MLKRILSLLMAAIMSMFMLAGCSGSSSGGSTSTAKEEETVSEPSAEYVAVLQKFGLEDVNYTFKGKKSVVFASEVSETTLEIMAFGYTDDIAEQMYDKVYMDISEYDDETIEAIDEQLRSTFDFIADYDFATIEYEIDKDINMYIIEIYYNDLSTDNVQTLIDEGLISGEEGMNQISVSDTVAGASENGLVQR